MAILMPALGRARNQAKLISGMVNFKQLGTVISAYQTDNDGAVPIVIDRWAAWYEDVPVKHCQVSFPIRDYLGAPPLPAHLDPEERWPGHMLQGVRLFEEYFDKYIPDFCVCPFTRGRGSSGDWYRDVGTITLKGPAGSMDFHLFKEKGAWECFVTNGTQQPSGRCKGFCPIPNHPYGEPHGSLKYGILNWFDNSALEMYESAEKGFVLGKLNPIKWSSKHAKEVRAGSMAEAIVSYCEMGENIIWPAYDGLWAIINYGSHAKGNRGGTNALFADMHVGWVIGSQIGWP
jgi:hypothetical protein